MTTDYEHNVDVRRVTEKIGLQNRLEELVHSADLYVTKRGEELSPGSDVLKTDVNPMLMKRFPSHFLINVNGSLRLYTLKNPETDHYASLVSFFSDPKKSQVNSQ